MSRHEAPNPERLGFYLTPVHECSYFEDRQARTVFADPAVTPSPAAQTTLAAHGFRRSGRYLYRPQCPGCRACIPARIPVADFHPDRSQRRTRARNRDLEVRERPAVFDPEHYELYNRYQSARHPDGSMAAGSPEQYLEYLTSHWSHTRFHEFRLGERLLAVAVVDHLGDGLSAVYTFFDPEQRHRGLGTQAILWQIDHARAHGLPWVYLGYWIAESPKMNYKARFRPLEIMRGGAWHRLRPGETDTGIPSGTPS